MTFQKNFWKKSIFHCQNDWSGYGPAGQFRLLESALVNRKSGGRWWDKGRPQARVKELSDSRLKRKRNWLDDIDKTELRYRYA